jgi:endonuclease YncB( thermonuclease family)
MKTLMLLCSLITVIPAANLTAKVVGVKSGAAIEVLSEGKVMAVRIQGIDCADKTYAAGKAARHYIADNAFMNDVSVEITGTESDGTLIGKVLLQSGADLGMEMTKAGLVWWDKQKSPDNVAMAKLEKEARDAFLGIWAGSNEEDEEDFGKEVLAKRELADKNNTALLTQAGN